MSSNPSSNNSTLVNDNSPPKTPEVGNAPLDPPAGWEANNEEIDDVEVLGIPYRWTGLSQMADAIKYDWGFIEKLEYLEYRAASQAVRAWKLARQVRGDAQDVEQSIRDYTERACEIKGRMKIMMREAKKEEVEGLEHWDALVPEAKAWAKMLKTDHAEWVKERVNAEWVEEMTWNLLFPFEEQLKEAYELKWPLPIPEGVDPAKVWPVPPKCENACKMTPVWRVWLKEPESMGWGKYSRLDLCRKCAGERKENTVGKKQVRKYQWVQMDMGDK